MGLSACQFYGESAIIFDTIRSKAIEAVSLFGTKRANALGKVGSRVSTLME